MSDKLKPHHLARKAILHVRQSSAHQVMHNQESRLLQMCRVVDTLLVDQETVYAPRQGNDRLLLGLKGSLNEYELDPRIPVITIRRERICRCARMRRSVDRSSERERLLLRRCCRAASLLFADMIFRRDRVPCMRAVEPLHAHIGCARVSGSQFTHFGQESSLSISFANNSPPVVLTFDHLE